MRGLEMLADAPFRRAYLVALAVHFRAAARSGPRLPMSATLLETGMAKIIIPRAGVAALRSIGVSASTLLVHGRAERLDGAVSLLGTPAERLRGVAVARSGDFR